MEGLKYLVFKTSVFGLGFDFWDLDLNFYWKDPGPRNEYEAKPLNSCIS